jgi:hypothetical protein
VTVVDNVYTGTPDCPRCTLTLGEYVTITTPGTKTVTEFAATSLVLTTVATLTNYG